jgi:hypothetical protein
MADRAIIWEPAAGIDSPARLGSAISCPRRAGAIIYTAVTRF